LNGRTKRSESPIPPPPDHDNSIDPETYHAIRTIFEFHEDALFVKDLQGRYIVFNEAAGKLVGVSPEDVVGNDDTSIFDTGSVRLLQERDRRILEHGVKDISEEVLTASGVTRVYRAIKAPYKDADGNLVGILGISRDITSQKLAEERLAASLSQLAQTEKHAEVGYWEVNLETGEVEASKEARRLFSVPDDVENVDREVLLSKVGREDRRLEQQSFDEAIEGTNPYFAELRVPDEDESHRYLLCQAEVERDNSGRATRFHATVQNVTEQQRALSELRQSEHRYRLTLEALPVGVQVMDTEGNILLSNSACQEIWGRIVESGAERYHAVKGWWHGTETEVKPDEWASKRALSQGESTFNEKVDIVGFDGRQRTILNSAVPIRDNQLDVVGAVVLNEDVTERLRLERQFQQAQKMEALGLLAGGVAHDFNNLLTVVSGCTEILYSDTKDDPERASLLSQIQQATRQASSLTQQLLAFSRQTVVQPRVIDLNESVKRSEMMLRRLIGEDIELTLKLEQTGPSVKVDPVQMDQVLLNLVVNARDAMPTGGRLTIETSAGEYVTLSVTDTGSGMTPEVKERLFEPFFTTKTEGRGTGLGLSTVYGIVEQNDGFLEVESEVGEGTTFRVFFPVADQKPATPEATTKLSEDLRGSETVLLVEDQPSVRTTLERALKKFGYHVTVAGNGEEALEKWDTEGPFQVVVTDVVMPIMGGRALAENLLERDPAVKLVYMSGHTTDAVLRHGVQSAEVTYLQKPFDLRELFQVIRGLLQD